MNVYSPSEVSELIGIKTATLRKYSLLLESEGYEIARNSKRHRYYRDKDVMTIRNIITASNNGVTLVEAIKNVVNLKNHNNESNVINNGEDAKSNDMKELKEMIKKQNELIYNLTKKLDQQQIYIDQQIDNRLMNFKESNNQIEGRKENEDKYSEILSEHKVKNRLEEEAFILWEKKPPKERLRNFGWFRVKEDIEKRDLFIKDYINKNFEIYFKKELDIY